MRTTLGSALACVWLCLGLFPALSVTAAYPPEAYEGAVTALSGAGVIDASTVAAARVYEYVNRAEAIKVIVQSSAALRAQVALATKNMPPISLFPDIDQHAWFAPYVEVGYRGGLLKGYPDGLLRPVTGVKVGEAVVMLVRSMGGATGAEFLSSPDLPNTQGQWYTESVSKVLSKNGIMGGSTLRADGYMTRGQLFDLVYRMAFVQSAASASAAQHPVVGGSAATVYASSKSFAITIPSIGITDLTVTHPADPETQKGVLAPLKTGVGHLFAYPGTGSKVMIYGHSSGYPWDLSEFTKIFRGINKINVGDKIYVTYDKKLYVYQATEKRTVSAKDLSSLDPDAGGEELVLYTCWPPDSITYRLLIIAKPIETIALR